jgi:A/G-specific adenine glycosylase
MGYNNRAVRLHALARMLVRGHRGAVPRDPEILAALPGIGPYTLAAVRCFAFGERVPVVDVNVRRVLSRVAVPQAGTADLLPEAEVADLAGELLPARGAEEWNQALMDLGARVCTARAPRCDACPVADACVSRTVIRPSSRRRAPAEPSRNGVPDRLTRGRIVETLRALPAGRWIAADPLARRVAPGFCAHERAWFLRLLHALERDSVIRIAPGTSVRVRLA